MVPFEQQYILDRLPVGVAVLNTYHTLQIAQLHQGFGSYASACKLRDVVDYKLRFNRVMYCLVVADDLPLCFVFKVIRGGNHKAVKSILLKLLNLPNYSSS